MIRQIVRKEVMETVRDGRFRASAFIVFALLVVSIASGWQQHRSLVAEHEAANRLAREQWMSQGSLRPHAAAHYGTYVFKPQASLAFFDRGITPYAGTSVFLQAHHQHDAQLRGAQDAPSNHRFADMTAAVVLQVMLPLLIVLLLSPTFAGEREQGTLRQLLAVGVPRRRLILGRALGSAVSLAILLVPAVVIGAIVVTLGGGIAPMPDGVVRITFLTATYLLYLTAFVGIALTVSALAPTARAALTVLLGFWIASVFVLPRAAADLARTALPTPSRFVFQQEMYEAIAQGLDGHNPEGERGVQFERQVLEKYGVSRLEDLPVSYSGLALQAGEESDAEVWDGFYGAVWDRFEGQNRVQQIVSIIAPALAIRSASMALSGTDFSQHRHFAEAAEQYRRTLVGAMNEDLTVHGRAGVGYDWEYAAGAELWTAVDAFRYEPPGVGWVLERQWIALAVLGVWAIVAMGAAIAAARRMQPV